MADLLESIDGGGRVVRIHCQDPDCPSPYLGFWDRDYWTTATATTVRSEHEWTHHVLPGHAPAVAAFDNTMLNGPDGGRQEAFEQTQADLIRQQVLRGAMTQEQFREAYVGGVDVPPDYDGVIRSLDGVYDAETHIVADAESGFDGFGESLRDDYMSTPQPRGLIAQAQAWLDADEDRMLRSTLSPLEAERATCAHVCGPDPDHACDARAATFLDHPNLAGGVTRMPICGPCYDAERAEVAHV